VRDQRIDGGDMRGGDDLLFREQAANLGQRCDEFFRWAG
jgi:hypothetical protein